MTNQKMPVAKISIIFENKDFIIIDKPSGLSVHNESPSETSVIQILGEQYKPVHRLDKETSGLLALARTRESAQALAEIFQQHRIAKEYQALLRGSIEQSEFRWTWPISDKSEGRKNPQGLSKDRKEALTTGRLLQRNKYFSLVQLKLSTGRQHQIRKHSALARHPIVGDPRYNDPTYNKKIFELYKINRMFLHASHLSFEFQNEKFSFESPILEEFKRLLE